LLTSAVNHDHSMSDKDNFMLDCSEFMSSYNSLDSVDGQNTSWNIKVKLSRCSVVMEGVSRTSILVWMVSEAEWAAWVCCKWTRTSYIIPKLCTECL